MRRSVWVKTICCILLLYWVPSAFAGSAISVPRDARAIIADALAALEELLFKKEQEKAQTVEATEERTQAEIEAEREAFLAEAEQYARSADIRLESARKAVEDLRQRYVKTERDLAAAKAARKKAADEARIATEKWQKLSTAADKAMNEAEAMYRSAARNEAALKRKAAAIRRTLATQVARSQPLLPPRSGDFAEKHLDKTEEMRMSEFEQKRMEREQRQNVRQPSMKLSEDPESLLAQLNWTTVDNAYNRAEARERAAKRAAKQSELALLAMDRLNTLADEAADKLRDAEEELENTRQELGEAEIGVEQARADAIQTHMDWDALQISIAADIEAETQVEEALDEGNRPRSIMSGARYSTWDDGRQRSGYQLAIPFSYSKWDPDFSYSIFTQYVVSNYLSTLTDTSVFLSKVHATPKYDIEYSLGINVPTGKSALGWKERYARVTEDLTEVEQFGKGWQFVPGIAISWKTSERERWTIGTNYTFSTSYDPTSDIPNDDISPGGEWGMFLRYQRLEDKWQFVGELLGTIYGTSNIDDGTSYKDNNSWEAHLNYNRVLPNGQNLMFYYWLENKGDSNVPSFTSNALVHYLGTQWSKQLDDKRRIRAAIDVMTTGGNRFYGMYSYYDYLLNPRYGAETVDGRTKYTAGIGYDHQFDQNTGLTLDLQYFRMNDGQSSRGYPATTYNGGSVFLTFFKKF